MYVFAVLKNRNETMQFINILKRSHIVVDLVSTPKGLGSSCSVSAKFFFKDIERVKSIVAYYNFTGVKNYFKLTNRFNHAMYELL